MAELFFCDHCLCNKARQYAVKSWGSTIYAVFGHIVIKQDGMQISLVVDRWGEHNDDGYGAICC